MNADFPPSRECPTPFSHSRTGKDHNFKKEKKTISILPQRQKSNPRQGGMVTCVVPSMIRATSALPLLQNVQIPGSRSHEFPQDAKRSDQRRGTSHCSFLSPSCVRRRRQKNARTEPDTLGVRCGPGPLAAPHWERKPHVVYSPVGRDGGISNCFFHASTESLRFYSIIL